MLHKDWNSKGEMPYCFPRSSIKFQGHTVQNITDFDPNWAFPDYRPVAAFKSPRFASFQINLFVRHLVYISRLINTAVHENCLYGYDINDYVQLKFIYCYCNVSTCWKSVLKNVSMEKKHLWCHFFNMLKHCYSNKQIFINRYYW